MQIGIYYLDTSFRRQKQRMGDIKNKRLVPFKAIHSFFFFKL